MKPVRIRLIDKLHSYPLWYYVTKHLPVDSDILYNNSMYYRFSQLYICKAILIDQIYYAVVN